MKTQNQEVLEHLKKGNKLSSGTAFYLFRITRLSARIYDLRAEGYNIVGEWVKRRSKRSGKMTRYCIYSLEE